MWKVGPGPRGRTNVAGRTGASRRAGAALLEVVLSLALFLMAGGAIAIGLENTLGVAGRLRAQAQAMDLAVTKLSEVQLGLVELKDEGPVSFAEEYEDDRYAGWTWEIVTETEENNELQEPLTRVQVIVRHEPTGRMCRLVHLLAETGGLAGGAEEEVAP